jgi:hypothetical protein
VAAGEQCDGTNGRAVVASRRVVGDRGMEGGGGGGFSNGVHRGVGAGEGKRGARYDFLNSSVLQYIRWLTGECTTTYIPRLTNECTIPNFIG